MTCFFYVEGKQDSETHADAVVAACAAFLEQNSLTNPAHCVRQEVGGSLNVGLNLGDDASTSHFMDDVVTVLEFITNLASKLQVTFVAGTGREDRIWIDPNTTNDLGPLAAFLAAP